jgi:hypothetical protein
MSRRRRLLGVYARIGRTYGAWGPSLTLLAVIVFVPLGLADALLHGIDTSSLDLDHGFKVAAVLGAIAAITASGLFGEVFFSGAVAISLTHPEHERPPSMRQIASRISYLKLIAVDIAYVIMVAVGAIFLILPGVLLFVFFALAGPVVELEKHSVRGGFARSFRLVRGHFWMVAAVVIPVEIFGDVVNDLAVGLSHDVFGDGLLAAWVGESVSNIVTTPVFAIAVVLLTLDLIHHHDGAGPRLKRRPAPVVRAETAGAAA